jgi:hypothetical protein
VPVYVLEAGRQLEGERRRPGGGDRDLADLVNMVSPSLAVPACPVGFA